MWLLRFDPDCFLWVGRWFVPHEELLEKTYMNYCNLLCIYKYLSLCLIIHLMQISYKHINCYISHSDKLKWACHPMNSFCQLVHSPGYEAWITETVKLIKSN